MVAEIVEKVVMIHPDFLNHFGGERLAVLTHDCHLPRNMSIRQGTCDNCWNLQCPHTAAS